MKKLIISIMLIGFIIPIKSQVVELSEVVVSAVNYKYLQGVGSVDAAVPVQLLEEKVAYYDLKNSDLYSDEYDTYTVSFYIPEGRIVALYDNEGNVIKTIERFKDVALPKIIRETVSKKFPGWSYKKDVYKVNYEQGREDSKQFYKIKLENGDQLIKIKIDEEGNFL